ncbi:MAG: hydantoinase/oxoprolinase family protein [Burkholderiales bacterium]|nr:hydantoinase/oxoprolinase family protein [Burkholderiales bacterium]
MRLSVDVGGTFTDVVAIDENGDLHVRKALSTPHDQSIGVLDGIAGLSRQLGTTLEALLARATLFIHGTTVATNLLIERKGARVGLVTTEGFRDLLEIREGTKADRYDLREAFPQPLVPRPLRRGVPERVRWDGAVEKPLDETALQRVLRELRDQGVDALVIGFLNAHRNPSHEIAVRELVEQSGWQTYVSLGHEILAQEGEYDRLSTAAVNSYVGPGLKRYLDNLALRLLSSGLRVPLMSMQSTGGALPVDQSVRHAAGALTSGPAGGAMAGAFFARQYGEQRMVTYDMGGTSTDICLIDGGRPLERQKTDFGDVKVVAPTLDVTALGAGGGSIAKLDHGGILDLGPESAGARPGPACYQQGGVLPTVTDANVVLGYISPDTFLGGRMTLSRDLAVAAIRKHIAEPLGVSVEEASYAINALANARIAEGIRAATVRRGRDPRDYALFSFGGAGGVHADMVGRELLIPKIVIPREAAVLSALGFLSSDIRHDLSAPVGKPAPRLEPGELKSVFDGLEARGRALLAAEGFASDRVRLVRMLDCRYHRQVFSVEVPVEAGDLERSDDAWLVRKFEASYRTLYQHVHEDVPGFVDTCRIAVFGMQPPLVLKERPAGATDASPACRGSRRVYLQAWTQAPVYWFDDLLSGMVLKGPALVDSASTSVLVVAGSTAVIDPLGSIHITRERE